MAIRLALFMLLTLFMSVLPATAKFDQSHQVWTKELTRYVDGQLVHYEPWKKDQRGITNYLKQLAGISRGEYEKFSDSEKKALWINAYNAITVKIVLEHYPIKGTKPYYPSNSLRQIADVWEDFRYKIAGHEVDLNTIEHEMIRKLQDPRMHFAVVCASNGCPQLLNRAYVAATMDKDLEDATKRYFSLTKNVQYDPSKKEIRVSKLFSWFPLDFAAAAGFAKTFPPPTDDSIVLTYVLSMAPADVRAKFSEKDTRITYMLFDWSLNDADAPKATTPPGKSGSSLEPVPVAAGAVGKPPGTESVESVDGDMDPCCGGRRTPRGSK